MTETAPPLRVGIVVFDEVEVLDCCGPFEVFSVANRVAARHGRRAPFEVGMLATTPEVVARGGLVLRAHAVLGEAPAPDVLVVAGGVTDAAERDAALLDWLAVAAETARLTASVCTGAFLLAEAGILGGQRVTTHWEDQAELARRFPSLHVESGVRWVRDGDVFTSGGISAGIDLALHLVEVLGGRDLALGTARQMEYRWIEAPAAPAAPLG
ncbi:DJ-1/PfpI family protein [Agromyces seonyuensis]|uniref:DJ-1/PfpI family protein n=1 Tax=Agromyces seonyuensis TaxID=2662446 RepID=A0A6I4NUB4_9MICO|nr:DJ-1/PfpI family protein [Agromyces seonyuensis]MWB97870.1 DJ-1/PfpI family protein [Agromyces seonyuensis]